MSFTSWPPPTDTANPRLASSAVSGYQVNPPSGTYMRVERSASSTVSTSASRHSISAKTSLRSSSNSSAEGSSACSNSSSCSEETSHPSLCGSVSSEGSSTGASVDVSALVGLAGPAAFSSVGPPQAARPRAIVAAPTSHFLLEIRTIKPLVCLIFYKQFGSTICGPTPGGAGRAHPKRAAPEWRSKRPAPQRTGRVLVAVILPIRPGIYRPKPPKFLLRERVDRTGRHPRAVGLPFVIALIPRAGPPARGGVRRGPF